MKTKDIKELIGYNSKLNEIVQMKIQDIKSLGYNIIFEEQCHMNDVKIKYFLKLKGKVILESIHNYVYPYTYSPSDLTFRTWKNDCRIEILEDCIENLSKVNYGSLQTSF